VFGVADERMGEELAAWIRLTQGSQLSEQDLKAFCKGKVSYKPGPDEL
jgi:fatty-acyl-CoA synthase